MMATLFEPALEFSEAWQSGESGLRRHITSTLPTR